MHSSPRGVANLSDLLLIPEENRRHEILDGEIRKRQPSSFSHGHALAKLAGILGNFSRSERAPTKPGGWWLGISVTTQLAVHQIVEPDYAGWLRNRMTRLDGYPQIIQPDWICEVMDDDEGRRRDALLKRRIYADHGVPFYWLVDTERETLTVLTLTERGYVELLSASRSDRVHAAPFDLIELQVGTLFGDDED
jgi:Uma2 family endonuclease